MTRAKAVLDGCDVWVIRQYCNNNRHNSVVEITLWPRNSFKEHLHPPFEHSEMQVKTLTCEEETMNTHQSEMLLPSLGKQRKQKCSMV